MPNYTTKLNLEKPLGNEFYNIEVHNSNTDKIDAFANEIELRKLNKTGDTADDLKVTKVPVDLLDTVRKKELNSMAGGEIKGYIEDGGSHLVGEVWLSRNVKGEFKCLVANTDTYINAAKWVQIDDLTNAGKLENLNAYKEIYQYTVGGSHSINISEAKNYKIIEIYLAMSQGTGLFHDAKAVNIILNYPYTNMGLDGILGTDITDSSLCYYKVREKVPGTLTIEKSGVDTPLYARVRAFNKI